MQSGSQLMAKEKKTCVLCTKIYSSIGGGTVGILHLIHFNQFSQWHSFLIKSFKISVGFTLVEWNFQIRPKFKDVKNVIFNITSHKFLIQGQDFMF